MLKVKNSADRAEFYKARESSRYLAKTADPFHRGSGEKATSLQM